MIILQSQLFRQEAVDKMSTPDQLDTMLTVTNSRSWLGLVAMGLIVAVFLIWGFTGTVNTEVSGEGILLKPGGISRVVSPIEGQVQAVKVVPGDMIKEAQVTLILEHPETGEHTITSTSNGRILEVFVRKGDLLNPGSRLFSLEVGDDEEMLEAILFVPVEQGQQIEQGMEVKIASNVIRKEEYGYVLGQVVAVADYPSTFEGVLSVLGNEELSYRLMGAGLPIQVQVKLIQDEDTPSGYKWTTGRGPDTIISSGMLCQGSIIVRQDRPVNLFVPGI